jgi:hypothetical protein
MHKVIKPLFDSVSENGFSEGLLAAQKDGKYGYIDKDGNTIIPFVFSSAGDFKNGAAKISDESGLFGFINNTGETTNHP